MKSITGTAILIAIVFSSLSSQNFWQQAKGPYGGSITATLVLHSGKVLVGTGSNGIFSSTDGCASWTPANTGLVNSVTGNDVRGITCLALSVQDTLLVGTSIGAYRSTDAGAHWSFANSGLTGSAIRCFMVTPSNTIYTSVDYSGVYKSTDNGASWTKAGTGLTGTSVTSLVVNTSNGYLYAGDNSNGVFRSTDNGATWSAMNTNLTYKYVYSLALDTSGHVFAATNDGLHRSIDHAATWTSVNTGLSTSSQFTLYVDDQNSVYAGVMLASYGRSPTSGCIFRSTNNGDAWSRSDSGIGSIKVNCLSTGLSGQIFAGTEAGFLRTLNHGLVWTEANEGIMNTTIRGIVINSSDQLFAGVTVGGATAIADIYKSTDQGTTWTRLYRMPGDINGLQLNAQGHLFVGPGGYNVYRSTDNGTNWVQLKNGFTLMGATTFCFGFNSAGAIFAGTYDGVFKSTDNGDSWVQMVTGLTNKYIACIAVRNDTLYVGTGTSPSGGVFRSTDNGSNWAAINTGLTSLNVGAIAFNSQGHIFAGSSGVFRSTDNGANWTSTSNGMPSDFGYPTIYSLVINSKGHLFAATNNGVYHSTNNGDNWASLNDGLFNIFATSLALNSGNTLFVGTMGGICRSTSSTAVEENNGGHLPAIFSLEQNYPDPFNPSTTIQYGLPTRSSVRLVIYNILGQVVNELVNTEQQAGYQSVVWNANVSSGIYFFRLEATSKDDPSKRFVETKKMLLLK